MKKRTISPESLRRSYEFARNLGLSEAEAIQAGADSYSVEPSAVLLAIELEPA